HATSTGSAPRVTAQPRPDQGQHLPGRSATPVRAGAPDGQGLRVCRTPPGRLVGPPGAVAPARGRPVLCGGNGSPFRRSLGRGVLPLGGPQPVATRRPAVRPPCEVPHHRAGAPAPGRTGRCRG